MKKTIIIMLTLIIIIILSASIVQATPPNAFDEKGNEKGWEKTRCTTIQDGGITDSAGNAITMGFDQFGYNYQAHMFNGTYDGSDRNLDGTYWGIVADYVDDKLMMKWSDSWLANVDCDSNGKLDRGLVDSQVGGTSLGWLTNHVEGDYFDGSGNVQHYTDFVKIVWTGLGSPLWGQYTIIEEVYNDPSAGFHGLYSKMPSPGFGLNEHWTSE